MRTAFPPHSLQAARRPGSVSTMHPQRGAALLMGLIFTLAALLLTLGAVMSLIYQQRITASTRDRELAFQAAEAALRDAEMSLMCKTYTKGSNALGQCVAGHGSPGEPACLPGCGEGSATQTFALGFEPFDLDQKRCGWGLCVAPAADATSSSVAKLVDWSKEKELAPSRQGSTVPIGYFTGHPGYASRSVVAGVVAQPRFLIEAVPPKCDPSQTTLYCAYRITATGWGSRDSIVTLQELYRPW